MDIFFQDPNEIPLPPQEVRIRHLQVEPWADGRKVRITLEVDPFQKRPCVDVTIRNSQAIPVAQTSIVESMTRKMEFNMHLRQENPAGLYSLQVILYYQKEVSQPPPGEELIMPEPLQVDQREVSFEIQA